MTTQKIGKLEPESPPEPPLHDLDQAARIDGDEEALPPRPERRRTDFAGSKLPWLVEDFYGVTESVYEAVMIAAHRARQVGRWQKREIDDYNSAQVLTPESIEEEETAEKGIDHFQHSKPTVQALSELKQRLFEYYYLDREKK